MKKYGLFVFLMLCLFTFNIGKVDARASVNKICVYDFSGSKTGWIEYRILVFDNNTHTGTAYKANGSENSDNLLNWTATKDGAAPVGSWVVTNKTCPYVVFHDNTNGANTIDYWGFSDLATAQNFANNRKNNSSYSDHYIAVGTPTEDNPYQSNTCDDVVGTFTDTNVNDAAKRAMVCNVSNPGGVSVPLN